MIRKITLSLVLTIISSSAFAFSADLLEVFTQAEQSDARFQEAVSQRLATKEAVPINLAALLPNVSLTANPYVMRQGFSGSLYGIEPNTGIPLSPRNNTLQAYTLALNATQTIFNFAQFAALAGAVSTSKGADATFNAALQELMTRTSKAYFQVLQDEDDLSYAEAAKIAFQEQYDQVNEQYKVGLKTITDVYTAQASYASAQASYFAAQTKLINDRENLRVITGRYYPRLSQLRNDFPLVTPRPRRIEDWVRVAQQQNWTVKAAQYATFVGKQNVKQQFAGHLPTIQLQGTLSRLYNNNINGYTSFIQRSGPGTQTNRSIGLNVNVPLFAGGAVNAQTRQATYNYEVLQQRLEQALRNTENTTRQSYLGIILGISQIRADNQAIRSSISSLHGMEASYSVGTETLVNVLNQQQKVYEAQKQYAKDRYNYVNNVLALKASAGVLNFKDLAAINRWLIDKPRRHVRKRGWRSPK